MDIQKLKRISEAPQKGYVLSYLRDKVIFKRYESIDGLLNELTENEILELHLFDNDIEYRAVTSTSKRYSDGIIEDVIDFKYDSKSEECFKSDMILEDGFIKDIHKISVINHLVYDENGSVSVDNYRLIVEG